MVALGVGAIAVAGLYAFKKFIAGGRCNIEKDLSGHVAIITGGNTGIGK